MSRYRISESVGHRHEAVGSYRDLEKHHPSSGREPGRNYATLNGELEEVRNLPDGRTLVKKDFLLSHDGEGAVYVPSPAAGYVHYLNDRTNAVRIYDRPFGDPQARLLAQSLHMEPGTSPPEGSRVEYGQRLGQMGDTGTPGSFHAHVEMEPQRFERYVADIAGGVITPERYPPPAVAAQPVPQARPPAADTAPAPRAARGGSDGEFQPTPLSNLIGSGEGGYGSYNRGRAGDSSGAIDFGHMPLSEIMRRQALDSDDPQRLFAVGKFQMIPGTMSEGVRRMGLDASQPLTPALQERMFADFLVDEKRPHVRAYITGQADGPAGLGAAQLALAREFASVADPRTGRSYYDGDSAGNSASIRADQVGRALEQMRGEYQTNVQGGMTAEGAYRALGGGAPGQRTAPTPAARSDEGVLNKGDHGPRVSELQQQLRQLGVTDDKGRRLEVDGLFGPATDQAVRSFQRTHGLEVDGDVGRHTQTALQTARQAADPAPAAPATREPGTPAAREPGTPAAAGMANPAHANHPAYQHTLQKLDQLPAGTFRDAGERSNAAAAIAFEAKVSGLQRVDHVVLSRDGTGLFAVQGALDDPAHRRIFLDVRQAAQQPVEQSTRLMQEDSAPPAPTRPHVHDHERHAPVMG